MAGKHTGGSESLAAFISLTPAPQHFMPKNDKAYAEGRAAFVAGAAQADNPHGANQAAAELINQLDAWICWDNAWLILDAPITGFQLETATVDP